MNRLQTFQDQEKLDFSISEISPRKLLIIRFLNISKPGLRTFPRGPLCHHRIGDASNIISVEP